MREIKFRAKERYSGAWVYGALLKDNVFTYILNGNPKVTIGLQVTKEVAEVLPETVGQSTGLHDKNGRMIFEGDILCANTGVKWDNGIHSEYLQYAQVVYNDQKARFEILGKMGESHKALDQVVNKCRALLCGNIHDNPELMTAPKEATDGTKVK